MTDPVFSYPDKRFIPYLWTVTRQIADGAPIEPDHRVSRDARVAEIRDRFQRLRTEGWYPVHEPLPDPPTGRRYHPFSERCFYMAQARIMRSTTYPTLAKEYDLSSERIRQVIEKLVRRWRHPATYGSVAGIMSLRRGEIEACLLDLDRLGEDADPTYTEVHYPTVQALFAGINTHLAQFDACLMVPVPLEQTIDEIEAAKAAAKAKRVAWREAQALAEATEAERKGMELMRTQTPLQRARFYALCLTGGHRFRVIQEKVAIHQDVMVNDILSAIPIWNEAAVSQGLPRIELSKCDRRPWYEVYVGNTKQSYLGDHLKLRDAMVALGVCYRSRLLNIEDYVSPSLENMA